MRAVSPRTGADEITIAEEQLEYKPLVAAVYQVEGVPCLLTRWQFTDDDLARILDMPLDEVRALMKGRRREDLYLAVMTFGNPLQPMALQIGPDGYIVDG